MERQVPNNVSVRAEQALQKPPLPPWLVKLRTDAILDLSSTDPNKRAQAEDARAKNKGKISLYEKKVESAQSANNPLLEKEAQNKADFITELFEYVESLYRAFDRKKKAFNSDKEKIDKDLEDRLQHSWLKTLQKYVPILSGPIVAGAVVGSGIWEALTSNVSGIWKDILNFAGLVVMGSISYLIDRLAGRRRSKLTDKYQAKKDAIDRNEEDIRFNVLRLVEIEYYRLANTYGFEPYKMKEDTGHEQAHKIVKEMAQKYGVRLPLPDSLLNDVAMPAKLRRWRVFRSKMAEAFSALFGARKQAEQPSEMGQPTLQ